MRAFIRIRNNYVLHVPNEWAAVVFELKNLPRPKSPSFTTAVLVTKTLAGFISNERSDNNEIVNYRGYLCA